MIRSFSSSGQAAMFKNKIKGLQGRVSAIETRAGDWRPVHNSPPGILPLMATTYPIVPLSPVGHFKAIHGLGSLYIEILCSSLQPLSESIGHF